MGSRRRDKERAAAFERPDLDLKRAADLIYGEPDVLDEIDSRQVVVRPVSLDEIVIDPEIQVRVKGLDPETVEQYTQVLLNGGQFDEPIVLFRDEDTGKLILAAGFHRTEATRRALERAEEGQTIAPLTGEIRPGGRKAAVEFAEEDNLSHGLKLSYEDKRNILIRRLQRGHEWETLGDRKIAQKLGISHQTVGRWRTEFLEKNRPDSPTGPSGPVDTIRVGTDGKTRNVSKIRQANQRRAVPKREQPPAPRYVKDEYSQQFADDEPAIDIDAQDGGDLPAPDTPYDGPRAAPKSAATTSAPAAGKPPASDDQRAYEIVRTVATLIGVAPDAELTEPIVSRVILEMFAAAIVAMKWKGDLCSAQETETLIALFAKEWGLE